jgi:hypothetical protein
VPQLVSKAAESRLILIDAAALAVSDNGLSVEQSTRAAVQMSDTPTQGAVTLVSAFQTDSVFIKIRRFIHWQLAYADGAAFVDLPIGSPQ